MSHRGGLILISGHLDLISEEITKTTAKSLLREEERTCDPEGGHNEPLMKTPPPHGAQRPPRLENNKMTKKYICIYVSAPVYLRVVREKRREGFRAVSGIERVSVRSESAREQRHLAGTSPADQRIKHPLGWARLAVTQKTKLKDGK